MMCMLCYHIQINLFCTEFIFFYQNYCFSWLNESTFCYFKQVTVRSKSERERRFILACSFEVRSTNWNSHICVSSGGDWQYWNIHGGTCSWPVRRDAGYPLFLYCLCGLSLSCQIVHRAVFSHLIHSNCFIKLQPSDDIIWSSLHLDLTNINPCTVNLKFGYLAFRWVCETKSCSTYNTGIPGLATSLLLQASQTQNSMVFFDFLMLFSL